MKFNLIKSTVFANGWRCGAVLLASVCIVWVAFISSSAQLKTQKHVTSLEIGQASEGARVPVISDSALNDYEAFRRGDRFYVKIPLAEFAFSQPRFHGDGFDDVQDLHDERTKNNTAKGCGAQSVKVRAGLLKVYADID